jgi:hypothetical protein
VDIDNAKVGVVLRRRFFIALDDIRFLRRPSLKRPCRNRLYIKVVTLFMRSIELAHAYTHRSADIDGKRWDTQAFHQTQLEIKEGLAQFYTDCICHRLKERFPSALIAYEKLLSWQTGPYLVHKNWAVEHKAQKEVVRAATIKCRKSQISDYDQFLELVQAEEKALA